MFAGEDVPLVLSGKLCAIVKGHFKRRIVWLQQNVRHQNFAFQFRVLAFVARVLSQPKVWLIGDEDALAA